MTVPSLFLLALTGMVSGMSGEPHPRARTRLPDMPPPRQPKPVPALPPPNPAAQARALAIPPHETRAQRRERLRLASAKAQDNTSTTH